MLTWKLALLTGILVGVSHADVPISATPVAPSPALDRGTYLSSHLSQLEGELAASRDPHILRVLQRARENALQVGRDVRQSGLWADSPVVYYGIPPISPIRRLPDTIPADGHITDRLRLIAAGGEFEPASFVAFPLQDVDRLQLAASALRGPQGTIAADAVDIRVVKCWYQAGTAWYSYFGDPSRRVLVPELLLHDDSLVRVDHATRSNYLRADYADGSRYLDISDPALLKRGERFNYCTEPIADSPRLLPVDLKAGEGKQFWITVQVPDSAAPGTYQGSISLSAGDRPLGQLSLSLQVLPFQLPGPRTYYDVDREFYTSIYNHCTMVEHLKMTGGDWAPVETRLLAEFRNLRDHNVLHPLRRGYRRGEGNELRRDLELMKQAGLRTRPVFGPVNAMVYSAEYATPERLAEFRETTDEAFALIEEVLGHRDLFARGFDEPGRKTVIAQRPLWEYIHQKGGRIYSTGKSWHLTWAGHAEDFTNLGGWTDRDKVAPWHQTGGLVSNYAAPHTGPENPDVARRAHGMVIYKDGEDGTFNYHYYEGTTNIWNEFGPGPYRSFCMVYPTRDDVIDTIAWEGFREGLDDIRYATQLKLLARTLLESEGQEDVYAARKALSWIETRDVRKADLNTVRVEMIRHILNLHERTEGGDL
ncbi:hypothetical protein ACFL6X_01185 [Candidatus Latescibacterota bacterium]